MTSRITLSLLLSTLALGAASPHVHAGERGDAITGAVIGTVAGAAIGHHISGRDGAILGGAIGAATGAAVATSDRREAARSVPYEARDDHGPRYREPVRVEYRERVIHERPVVRQRVVYRDPVVVYQPVRVVYKDKHRHARHDRGHHRGWDRGYAWNDRGNGRDQERWERDDRGHGRGRD